MDRQVRGARIKTTGLYSFVFLFGLIHAQENSEKSLDDILLDENIDFAFDDTIFNLSLIHI